ncbi:MAG: DEAD/DEAH box helicase [Bacteroidales bacterium]|nr:DEAD/DEAH box helicase [Bacteroidales bacterium]
MEKKLIYTLYRHKYLGSLVVPLMVNDEGKPFYSIHERITSENLQHYENIISKSQFDLVSIMMRYSDKTIFKRFTNKQITLREFYQSLSDEYIQKHIRPFIDKQIDKILHQIASKEIELYENLENEQNIYKSNRLKVHPEPAETVFNFIRNEEGIRYFQTIRHHGKDMKLTDEFAHILTIEPCWLVLGDSLYTFHERVDGNKLKPFLTKKFVQIPRNMEERYFNTFIKNSVKHYPVYAGGFQIIEHQPVIKPKLSIEKDWQGNATLRLYFMYGAREFMVHDKQKVFVNIDKENEEYKLYRISRKPDYEVQIAELLKMQGLQSPDQVYFTPVLPNEEDISAYVMINWLNENEDFIRKHNITIDQSHYNHTYFTGSMDVTLTYTEDNDWFDVHAVVKFGDFTVPFRMLRKHIMQNIREYELPNGEIAILPRKWFDRYQEIFAHAEDEEDGLKLRKHHFPLLQEKAYSREKEFMERLKDLNGNREQFRIPANLNATLRSYQRQGVEWMKLMTDNGLGACLADDMGLGKTLQTLTLLLAAKNKHNPPNPQGDEQTSSSTGSQLSLFDEQLQEASVNKTKPVEKESDQEAPGIHHTSLIVMPASLVHNWYFEILRFAPGLKTLIHAGNNRRSNTSLFDYYDVVLTTYGIVRNDISLLKKFPFHFVVLDESQVIKNPESKSHEAICRLNAKYRITLTGTPVENSLVDLWSQMQFLNPDMLGSLSFFKRYYQHPIEKDNDEQKEAKLRKLIQPFILRRTKQEVEKDLPPLTEKVYYCDMSEMQQNIYESEKSRIRNYLLETIDSKGINNSRFIVLRGLMRLRQIANHPVLTFHGTDADSGKFSEIIFNIESLMQENHKVLIFSSFVKHLELFENYFQKEGWKYAKLIGQSQNRQRIIQEFKENDDVKPFLISLKAGGVGLNLPEADYVFMLDPWWNPAAENQAISRAHRIGQRHNVFVYRFISRETLEEKIIRLQEKKAALAETFVNSSNPLSELTRENLEEILE